MQIKTHNGGWAVFADWFSGPSSGKERVVFGGVGTGIYECIAWERAMAPKVREAKEVYRERERATQAAWEAHR